MLEKNVSALCVDCSLPDTDEVRRIVSATIQTIARLGATTASEIKPNATFESMDKMPFWRACGDVGFDTQKLAEALQLELGMRFTEKQLQRIRDPDLNVGMTVAEFVRDVYTAMSDSKA